MAWKKPSSFSPVVSDGAHVRELTLRSLLLGILLGVIFAVGNTYLALRIGTTVSASIPAAVMSMTFMRLFSKKVSILENNIVQTIASVGEALAAGLIFTIPALFLLGDPPSIGRIFFLGSLGGILGVLFMIPMRRYIVVHEHGKLPFPEGTACAEILKAGNNRPNAILAMLGIASGAVHKFLSSGLGLWLETPTWNLRYFKSFIFSIDCTPALLGVGYIIGMRVTAVMFAGGVLGWWVFIPLIHLFGQGVDAINPSTIPISQLAADAIWSNYIRYIGAGTVAVGGIMGMVRIFPIVGKTITVGFREMIKYQGGRHVLRTDKDIPLHWLVSGSLAIILLLWLYPGMPMNFLTIVLLTVLGFFFVGVTSLTVGIIGSTSNPVSGITLTVLLITCLVFVALGWTERIYMIAAMTMGAVACTAVCMAATTSQDLKTGFIVGATPRSQQIAEIFGVLLPAFCIGGTLYLLNGTYTFGSPEMPAPQATLMALIVRGVINGDLPLILVLIGVVIGIVLLLLRIPILPFALGLYLPLSLSAGLMFGGVAGHLISSYNPSKKVGERGILISSGLVAGDACMGVLLALFYVTGLLSPSETAYLSPSASLLIYLLLAVGLGWMSVKAPKIFSPLE